MTTPAGDATTGVALTELSERQRERALDRYRNLRPHREQDAPLAEVARAVSLPLRTAQRWVSRYRRRLPEWMRPKSPSRPSTHPDRGSDDGSADVKEAARQRTEIPDELADGHSLLIPTEETV